MADDEQQLALPLAEPMTPPLPPWGYAIVNPTMKFILRSPLHGLLSKYLMILIYDGRKSGKRYSIPVGYRQDGDRLTLFSHAKWAKNFEGGRPVAVRLRGELQRGTAHVVHDPDVLRAAVQQIVSDNNEMAARMGFVAPGPDGAPRMQIPRGTSFIEIELEP